MKKKKLVVLESLLGELNQLVMIKWGQGKPEGEVRLPPLHGSKLLTKFRTVS